RPLDRAHLRRLELSSRLLGFQGDERAPRAPQREFERGRERRSETRSLLDERRETPPLHAREEPAREAEGEPQDARRERERDELATVQLPRHERPPETERDPERSEHEPRA